MSTFAALAIEEAVVFVLAGTATIWLRMHLARTSRKAEQEPTN